MDILELQLSQRAEHAMKNCGIKTTGEMLDIEAWNKLKKQRNCGKKTISEIIASIDEFVKYLASGKDWYNNM